ncbi:MAG: hypothetical protein QG656_218, partial [Candidatus Hydrogenedentes bacterium]|nr:hypothetical protein [Candidatus Hydrogenedentota bacterium]
WIGYASDTVAGFQCGVENTASCAYAQACRGQLDGNTVAVGSCNSVVTPVMALVDGAWTATVVAAFSASRPAVDEALNTAREAGPAALFGETAAYWRDTLAGMPTVKDESLNRLARQCVATVLQCMDRNRGAIAQPPVSLDEPRDGFWLTLALDMAGFRDRAEAHTLFYGSVARREAALGMPLGSVPAASAADCLEGLPHVALNTDAAAWILGSFRQHAAFLDGDARKLYVSRVRETVQALGDFLVRWTDGQTGAPLASFDTGLLRDAQSIEKLMTALMGVGGAIALAEEAGQPVPPRWRQRNREMMALALVQCVDKDGRWKLDRLPPFWLPEIVASHAEPEAAAARRPGALEQLSGEAAARALCDLALAWRDQESRIETLRGVLKTVLARALERDSLDDGIPVPPVAVRAALLYIAIAEIAPK